MPTYWLPCPGKTKATGPATGPQPKCTSRATANGASGFAWMRSSAPRARETISSRVAPSTTRRSAAPALKASCRARTEAANTRPVGSPAKASTCAVSAAAVGAENGTASRGQCRRRSRSPARAPAYSSSTRWKLLPPKPKELRPALRVCPAARIHGRACVFRTKGLLATSSFGLGASILIVGGSTRWCRAKATFMSPAAPAADLVWPICDLIEPSAHHCFCPAAEGSSANARTSPANSAASPATVPVPWPSTSSMSRAANPARSSARRTARLCPSGRGA